MRSALVHDWILSETGGGEKVLKEMHVLFPSPIYTLIQHRKALVGTYFENLEIISSFLQNFPKSQTKHKMYLPFFPFAIEHFDLSLYDVILSSSHCAAKGVITSPGQLHICYCHTPMRYAWDLMHVYLQEEKLHRGVKGFFAKLILHYLRGWDVNSSARVDHFVANSKYVAKRIEKFYRRESSVIYPPVDVDFFQEKEKKEEYYITASRLVPYKKVDVIVEAFSQMPEKKLVVIGDGPEKKKVLQKAKKNIEFLGYQKDEVLRKYIQEAKGFVFASLEDFGIAPVEAMASGTPVIAYGKGGALESVIEKETGLFFEEQTPLSIQKAIEKFERLHISSSACRKRAEYFSKQRFQKEFREFVESKR